MCGICGVFNFRNLKPVDFALLQTMNKSMLHRGPDDEGYFLDQNVGIAMRRLAIIDLATGKQPIHNEDKSKWIVFNGEIFNYLDLRERMVKKGHRFTTNSDTETILHLYEEFGEHCVDYLRGMFAFAIWDGNEQSLFLARDRIGIKPLFYSVIADSTFVFGSEIKALLPVETINTSMDFQALDAFFTYCYIPAPLTIYKGIRKLLPGHWIKITPTGITTRKYWDLIFQPDHGKNERYFIEKFYEIFQDAVNMRLISEVPLGSFLSGGVDSSMIVAQMAMAMREPPHTYTIGFGGNSSSHIDERPYARMMAQAYNCLHNEIEVLPRADDILDEIVYAFDEPFADDSVIPTYYICRESKKSVTVALTGLGGDELFAGYERYLGFRLSLLYDKIPGFISDHFIIPLIESLPERQNGHYTINHMKRFLRASSLPLANRYQSYVSTMPGAVRSRIYTPDVARQIDFDTTDNIMIDKYTSENAATPLDRALYQDIKTYLPDDILALTDRIGMLHSQELRVPFTDHILMEFCATIPAEMKLKNLQKKYLLKKAAAPFVPKAVLNHRKQGFSSPMAQWLKEELKPLSENILSNTSIEKDGLFEWQFVENIINQHLERKALHDKFIFGLIMFQKWLKNNRECVCDSSIKTFQTV